MKNYPIEELTIQECNQVLQRIASRISNRRNLQSVSIIISNPDHKDLVLVTVDRKQESKCNRYKR